MVFGPSGCDQDSQNQLFLFLETPGRSKNKLKKNEWFLSNIIVGNRNSGKSKICKYWKRRGPKIPEGPSNMFWKSWIWDQYLSKNMKWTFGIQYGINIYKKAWSGNVVIWDQYPHGLSRKHELEIWQFQLKELKQVKDCRSQLRTLKHFQESPHPSTLRLPHLHQPPLGSPKSRFFNHNIFWSSMALFWESVRPVYC